MNRAIEKAETLKKDSEQKRLKAEADANYFKGSVDTCDALLLEFRKPEIAPAPEPAAAEITNDKDIEVVDLPKKATTKQRKAFTP